MPISVSNRSVSGRKSRVFSLAALASKNSSQRLGCKFPNSSLALGSSKSKSPACQSQGLEITFPLPFESSANVTRHLLPICILGCLNAISLAQSGTVNTSASATACETQNSKDDKYLNWSGTFSGVDTGEYDVVCCYAPVYGQQRYSRQMAIKQSKV